MSKIMAPVLEIIHRRWTASHGKSLFSLLQITPKHCTGNNMHPQQEWHKETETSNSRPLLLYIYLKQISQIILVVDRQKTADQSEQQFVKTQR